MALPTSGSYDSIYDQLLIVEGNKLKSAQLEYGTFNPTTNQWTDGSQALNLSSQYGFGPSANMNDFSLKAQLDRTQGAGRSDNMNNAAETGNLRSGGYKVRRDNLLFQQGAEQDSLSRDYTERLTNVRKQGLGAQQNYDSALTTGWESALQRKLQNDAATAIAAADAAAAAAAAQPAASDPAVPSGGGNPWAALQQQYNQGRWDHTTRKNVDGAEGADGRYPVGTYRLYRGQNGIMYRIYSDGRKVRQL